MYKVDLDYVGEVNHARLRTYQNGLQLRERQKFFFVIS